MRKLLTLSALLLFSVSCDIDRGPQCNQPAGWDEYGGEYLTKEEAERLNADCRKTVDEYHEDLERRR